MTIEKPQLTDDISLMAGCEVMLATIRDGYVETNLSFENEMNLIALITRFGQLLSQRNPSICLHCCAIKFALSEPSYGITMAALLSGRPGFDRGCKAAQGIPRTGHLVNPTGNA